MVPEERVLLLANLDRAAPVLRHQHLVSRLYRARHALALAVEAARPDGEHLGLVELLDGGLGEEDAAGGLGLGFDALDEDAVEEGGKGADGFQGGGLVKGGLAGVDVGAGVGSEGGAHSGFKVRRNWDLPS